MKRHISPEIRHEAALLYLKSDLTAAQVAEQYSITERTLMRWVQEFRSRQLTAAGA